MSGKNVLAFGIYPFVRFQLSRVTCINQLTRPLYACYLPMFHVNFLSLLRSNEIPFDEQLIEIV